MSREVEALIGYLVLYKVYFWCRTDEPQADGVMGTFHVKRRRSTFAEFAEVSCSIRPMRFLSIQLEERDEIKLCYVGAIDCGILIYSAAIFSSFS